MTKCPALAAAALVVFAAGCGGADIAPRLPATGYVTLDGVPLSGAVVRLVPLEPTTGPVAIAAIEDGDFAFDDDNGPVAGKHRVEIAYTSDGEAAFDNEELVARVAAGEVPPPPPPPTIPSRYNSESRLTAIAEADTENEFRFDLSTAR